MTRLQTGSSQRIDEDERGSSGRAEERDMVAAARPQLKSPLR